MTTPYPKRLIEVDLPIKKISAHARREKSIRHGHISTLHIWWARRPLAACRAVICAALWPDPADEQCPQAFRDAAAKALAEFAEQVRHDAKLAGLVQDHWQRWNRTNEATFQNLTHSAAYADMRHALLDFIADFANWDASTIPAFLDTARALTQAAHESLDGLPDTRPLVVDPFAGGGAIPLEALRVGADAFASDLNPVAVLLNKVVLEYIPKYGQQLADEVRKWGQWIKEEAEKELAEFYPQDPDGATPIAYLWARTIISEAPDDGSGIPVEVPLMRSLWLAKKTGRNVALRWVRDANGKVQTETIDLTYADGITRAVRRPLLEIFEPKKASEVEDGTVARGSATCPVTGYTTPVESVRRQLIQRRGGASDARLLVIVASASNQKGRLYRLPDDQDAKAVIQAARELRNRQDRLEGKISFVPDESVNPLPHSVNRLPMYGMQSWGDVYTPRQALALGVLTELARKLPGRLHGLGDNKLASAIQICLALAIGRLSDRSSTLCRWDPSPAASGVLGTFSRQALTFISDFVEGAPLEQKSGGWLSTLEWIIKVIEREGAVLGETSGAEAHRISATTHVLPDDSVQAFVTDPPYYDMISYADLSDYFFVWFKRIFKNSDFEGGEFYLTPKREEIIVEPTEVEGVGIKNEDYYLENMSKALSEGRRVSHPHGIGIVVFAHKSTSGWESLLQSLVNAGWIVTGSWPIDTEMATKVAGIGQARLLSSVHLVCRPREKPDGSLAVNIGDWRDILQQLPQRIHAWLPRLAREGVVGADAIFACLGPALEIFSRYSRVEKASGEQVTLKEYLEYVWAAVSKEALGMVFAGADATGFEEDARLTAMWLWTLRTEVDQTNGNGKEVVASTGYTLEYDAARKIAQGLGAHLEKLDHLVEIKGSNARLLPVSARMRHLFGKEGVEAPTRSTKKRSNQLSLFDTGEAGEAAAEWGDLTASGHGETMLDRVHQSMLFFAAGRSEALRRFLVEEGVGQDSRYWSLANALSALYPSNTDEKRWVDGVLARKKGLGF